MNVEPDFNPMTDNELQTVTAKQKPMEATPSEPNRGGAPLGNTAAMAQGVATTDKEVVHTVRADGTDNPPAQQSIAVAAPESGETRRNKGGAKPGNVSAIKHGMRSRGYPKGCDHIRKQINLQEVAIADAVIAATGRELTIFEMATIEEAVEHAKAARLVARWLRLGFATFTPDQRLAHVLKGAQCLTARNRCLKELGLNTAARDADPWAVLDAPRLPPDATKT